MSVLENAIRRIEEQQPKEQTTVWGVGEQLKDILRGEPHLAEIVLQDLENKSMSLTECEKKIKARADEIHKTANGTGVCVTPMEAEGIIRRFYGLPERGERIATAPGAPRNDGGEVIDLADFF